jgi:pyruvate formate lyase activating enzyme
MSIINGIVHSIESMTAVDGFGLRFLVFLQGCYRRCVFCSNPDTMNVHNRKNIMSSNDILNHIKRDYQYLKPNNGGLTISGGDPLIQGDFVADLFKKTKDLGLTTCLDTSGLGRKEYYEDVLTNTDFTMLCAKSLNPDLHHLLSGIDIHHLYFFVNLLDKYNKQFRLRHVLITDGKYKTNSDDEIERLSEFINKRDNCNGIEILPYHNFGLHKWILLNKEYKMKNVKSPEKEEIKDFIDKLQLNLNKEKKIVI